MRNVEPLVASRSQIWGDSIVQRFTRAQHAPRFSRIPRFLVIVAPRISSTPSLTTQVEQDEQDTDPEDDQQRIASPGTPGVDHAMACQRARNQHPYLPNRSDGYYRDDCGVASESGFSAGDGTHQSIPRLPDSIVTPNAGFLLDSTAQSKNLAGAHRRAWRRRRDSPSQRRGTEETMKYAMRKVSTASPKCVHQSGGIL